MLTSWVLLKSMQTARKMFQASIQDEKEVIFFALGVWWTEKLPVLCGNRTVNEVEQLGSEPSGIARI